MENKERFRYNKIMNFNMTLSDKNFFKQLSKLAIPLSLQQLLGSAMEMIDSLMVSWIGMVSAVGSASQLLIIASTITWGMLSGTSIFAAQFFGKKDDASLKKIFFLSLLLVLLNASFWFALMWFFPEMIIRFYIQDDVTVSYALQYLQIARFSVILEAIAFTFSYMYRSIQMAGFTLKVSIFSMAANIILNYVFIFGWGFVPALHVKGAALATLLAHMLSIFIYLGYGLKHRVSFLGSFREMSQISLEFSVHVICKVIPLMINEALFGIGCSLIIKALGTLGKDSLEAYYIGDQIASFFSFIIWGYGGSVQIMLSHQLGEGKIQEAKEMCRSVLTLTVVLSILLFLVLLTGSPLIIQIYHIQSEAVLALIPYVCAVFAFRICFRCFNFTIFSILRSGGDSKIISFLDSGLLFGVAVPLAYLGIYVFGMKSVALVYLLSQSEQIVRFILGLKRIQKGFWAKDLTFIH